MKVWYCVYFVFHCGRCLYLSFVLSEKKRIPSTKSTGEEYEEIYPQHRLEIYTCIWMLLTPKKAFS